MKNHARAFVLGSFTFAGLLGTLACWPVASSGGTLSDAEAPPIVITDASGIVPADGGTVDATPGGEGGTGEGGDSGDAIAPFAAVATGLGFGCRIDGRGNVFCWGDGIYGRTGNPIDAGVPDAGDAGSTSDAGDSGGSADAGSDADAGSTGDAGIVTSRQVAGITSATAIALGDYHACAITSTQAVYCWGVNDAYQLGHPPEGSDAPCQPPGMGPLPCNPQPTLVSVPPAVAIAAAGKRTCILATDGTVHCWGAVQDVSASNALSASCGTGGESQGVVGQAPYLVPGISGVTQLAVAFDHACSLATGGQLDCWGKNDEWQTSHQYCSPDSGPGSPAFPLSAGVAVGTGFSCALVEDAGTVSCVGDNTYGALGHSPGSSGDLDTDGGAYNINPVPVVGLGSARELVAGGSLPGTQAACAIVDGGAVSCWGAVAIDAGGTGLPAALSVPRPIGSLGAPGSQYLCGIALDQSIWCWNLAAGAAAVQIQ